MILFLQDDPGFANRWVVNLWWSRSVKCIKKIYRRETERESKSRKWLKIQRMRKKGRDTDRDMTKWTRRDQVVCVI
jgi:hypothetical protein